MSSKFAPFTELLSAIIDNRGRTCPVGSTGVPLIATNCVSNDTLYPSYETTRFVDEDTYKNWFRGHPKPGDILFVCKGSPGRTNLVPSPVDFCIAQDMVAVRADPEKVNPKYLFAVLRSSIVQRQIDNMHVGTLIPHFKKGDFDKLLIPLMDEEEQAQIGELYFEMSRKIDLNRRINQTLEAMAQAIFKSWFVDFDPVKAKIAAIQQGRDPLRAAMTAISGKPDAEFDNLLPDQYEQLSATAALFPEEMEDSELGEIPKGWEVQRVGNVLELVYGKALKSTDRQEGDVPVYGSGGITGYHNAPLVPHGSIIVGRKGTVGSLYWEDMPFFPIDTTYYVRPLAAPLTFCYYAMQTLGLEKMNTDAAVPGLNRENVYRLELVLPSSSALQKFDVDVSLLRNAIRANSESNSALADLRDTLLPKLLSGELSVADAIAEAEA